MSIHLASISSSSSIDSDKSSDSDGGSESYKSTCTGIGVDDKGYDIFPSGHKNLFDDVMPDF